MYIYNPKSKVVHKTDEDGRTHERCNVDQIVNSIKTNSLSEIEVTYHLCKRCFNVKRMVS